MAKKMVALVLVVACGAGALFLFQKNKKASDEASVTAPEKVRFLADDLQKECDADAEATADRLRDAEVEVAGKVAVVDAATADLVVKLATSQETKHVALSIDDAAKEAVRTADLKAGQDVVLVCKSASCAAGVVAGKACVLR